MVDCDELLIPLADIGGALAGFILGLGICGWKTFSPMMFTVFKDLGEARHGKVKKRDETFANSILSFFKTLDETLGSGIGWSLSPTSSKAAR